LPGLMVFTSSSRPMMLSSSVGSIPLSMLLILPGPSRECREQR
jgi:hypothetical protein